MSQYYSYDDILKKKDLNGNDPSLYIITSNRSDGKTTATKMMFIKDFIKSECTHQFAFIYRYSYELSSLGSMFDDIFEIDPTLKGEITLKSHCKGMMVEVLYNDVTMCWGFSLNNIDSLKKYSALFRNIEQMCFDEYQTESGKYLNREVEKLQSLIITVARGGGKQSRPIKVFLCGNNVTLLNPYLLSLEVYKRIKPNMRFCRGDGWICEFHYNENASKAIKENPINNIFTKSKYMEYSTENKYLVDNSAFITAQPKGKNKYMATFVIDGSKYAIREYWRDGMIYINKKVSSGELKIAFKPSDHNQNTMLIDHYSELYKYLKKCYNNGCVYFADEDCKNAFFNVMAIDLYK